MCRRDFRRGDKGIVAFPADIGKTEADLRSSMKENHYFVRIFTLDDLKQRETSDTFN